jgi:hypothetical protein
MGNRRHPRRNRRTPIMITTAGDKERDTLCRNLNNPTFSLEIDFKFSGG